MKTQPLATSIARLLALATFSLFSTAHAVDDTVTGAAGLHGSPGASGNAFTPGTPGANGTPGGNAVANAVSGDPTNRATATGGNGGWGGDGGSGSVGAAAGIGAAGGNATATATTNQVNPAPAGPFITNATARGGNGGAGGFGGFGGNGTNGNGADGGVGGAAIAAALMTGPLGPSLPAVLFNEVIAVATGGIGGNGFSRGGPPGVGGDSGDGGQATATAHADGVSGAGNLLVSATQTGGSAGFSASGGHAGNGADSVMLNAVSGTTLFPYQLELRQTAVAGGAGHAFDPAVGNFIEEIITTPGTAGNASSLLTAGNPGGGILVTRVSATGGYGGDNGTGISNGGGGGPLFTSGNATDGGSGTAGVSLTGSSSVVAFVTARGGAGGKAEGRGAYGIGGNGGAAVLAPITAQTTNPGNVTITAEAFGGAGGGSELGIAGAGASVNLLNELDGSPGVTGSLFLIQRAVGGVGGFSIDGTLGQAGVATSTLNVTKSVASYRSEAIAVGGTGAERKSTAGVAGTGGAANASNTARNDAGSVDVRAFATGGTGGNGNNGIPGEPALFAASAGSGDGGSANSLADGRTEQDGQGLFVESRATGGEAGRILWGHAAAGGGNGGAAISSAIGTLMGDSVAQVFSTAAGGRGGGMGQILGVGVDGPGGDGGNASATATFTAATGGSGNVHATAGGGSGGGASVPNQTGGAGGTATASASGVSFGGASLSVLATVAGGGGGDGFFGGNGGSAVLTNAVSASTSGAVFLSQHAQGGYAGGAFGAGTPGMAGTASSSLTVSDLVASSLSGQSVAQGGQGGSTFGHASPGTAGGAAFASLDLTGSGDVSVSADAFGGEGGFAQTLAGGLGGTATLGTVRGVSTNGGAVSVTGGVHGGNGGGSGDGTATAGRSVTLQNAVEGSTSGALQLQQFAYGGDGGSKNSVLPGASAAGGAATSILERSQSFASGIFLAESNGGTGGQNANGTVGAGGAATARVNGTNLLSGGTIEILARANGGLPGERFDVALDAPAGAASAEATGTASGPGATAAVTAEATSLRRQEGFGGGENIPIARSTIGSAALATATGNGPDGTVVARAQSYGGAVLEAVSTSVTNILNTSSAESTVRVAEPASGNGAGRQAYTLLTALPIAPDVTSATSGSPDATQAFSMNDPDVFALGLLGASFAGNAAGSPIISGASFSLSIDVAQLADPRHLLFGFVNPEFTGAGFDVLHFTLSIEELPVLDVNFTDTASALSYFEDFVFDAGQIEPGLEPNALEVPTLDVFAQLTVTTSTPGDGFSVQTLVANSVVPEPSSALLVVIGGLGLALRRRR